VTPEERAALRNEWLQGVEEEIERRRQARIEATGGDPLTLLLLRLDEMGARLRAAPDYRPPTPEENEQATAEIEALFRERGYGRHG
jgi:hypothetical protein